ncbi:hypothetical protein C0Z18_02040 [Trinickia dabaoshanensis]|uniref:Uncharacterized protein n=1 Tax=Trinickia dabaoshanensis TaxID=564714 RepID=A0A2N7W0X3_9BURK|nr:hypothetical protein [Trinickia dabaoshanensis]PMS23025.1 hypothetical protein C0Z18_02040 [Trinickia dabaoshanensis]
MSTEQNEQQTQEMQHARSKAVEANVTAIFAEMRAAIADALQALPRGTRNKEVLDLTNAAATVSIQALGKAPEGTVWRIDRSVLSQTEARSEAKMVASTALSKGNVPRGDVEHARQRSECARQCDEKRVGTGLGRASG